MNFSYNFKRVDKAYEIVSVATPTLKIMLSIRSRMLVYLMDIPLNLKITSVSSPMRKIVTLDKASFWGFYTLAKKSLTMQYYWS